MEQSKYFGSQSKMQSSTYSQKSNFMFETELEKQKYRTIKKILQMSTMEKTIMKKLLDILEKKVQLSLDKKIELQNHAQTILDKDKQKELDILLDLLFGNDESPGQYNKDLILKIIKYYVLSPVEKQYITSIQKELEQSEQLDKEIAQVQEQIDEGKLKKLQRNKEEKKGRKPANKETCEALLKEIQVHENKLEKANQRLNEIVANNNKLRKKVNELRNEKQVTDQIYVTLKSELENKKLNVEKTINAAGEAYHHRNKAEEELKLLQEKAEKQKEEFEREYKELNKNIQQDKRFKEFIKSKQNEKDVLENLEKQIKKNEQIIKEKMEANQAIDNEYLLSAQKEEEIKYAFERIKRETGINKSKEEETKELLNVFVGLYQKNTIMNRFVQELSSEVEELETKIEEKKKEIQLYSTKGATSDNQRREIKIALMNKIQKEEKKKAVLKQQYEKSIETINLIKGYLENVFRSIEVEPQIIDKLRNSAITEENMIYFLGILEEKGIDAISEYARLIAEQLKIEKGDVPGVQQQIDDLNNIIAYENANIMNYYSSANQNKQDCPDDILKPDDEEINNFLSQEELRKAALETLNKKFLGGNNTEKKGQTSLRQSKLSKERKSIRKQQ